MSLQEYSIDDLCVIGQPSAGADDGPRKPGDTVRHVNDNSAYGVVVAISEGRASVLWSREPFSRQWLSTGSFMGVAFAFAPYVPIQVTPSIFTTTGSLGGFVHYSKKRVNPTYYDTITVDRMLLSGST